MGLFDFAKEIGNKIFSTEEDAAQKISDYMQQNNPGVEDLNVIFKDGKATLIGTAENPEIAQKAVLIAGNIRGVEEVIARIDIPEIVAQGIDVAQALEPTDVQYYVIQSGDTLSKIAKQFYGNANDYPKIFEANREVIKDPNLIYPGQKIRIPTALA